MIVRAVTVWVKLPFAADFELATKENHTASLREPGVLRFDVLKRNDVPGEYLLYEVYRSHEATEEHKTTPHYRKWRETVEPWMERPRSGIAYEALAPAAEAGWKSSSYE